MHVQAEKPELLVFDGFRKQEDARPGRKARASFKNIKDSACLSGGLKL
jgi:hypothetical protein